MSWRPPKRTRWQRIVYSAVGWLCILLGIIGGLIPILQGWIFILAGIVILSREHEWVYNLVARFKKRYPKVGEWMDRGSAKAHRLAEKVLRRFRMA